MAIEAPRKGRLRLLSVIIPPDRNITFVYESSSQILFWIYSEYALGPQN